MLMLDGRNDLYKKINVLIQFEHNLIFAVMHEKSFMHVYHPSHEAKLFYFYHTYQ